MNKLTENYEEDLIERLKNSEYAVEYLNVILDSEDDEKKEETFLLALRDIAKANGVSQTAKKAKLGRESLYKSLSENGNPKFGTLLTLLSSLGMKLKLEAVHK